MQRGIVQYLTLTEEEYHHKSRSRHRRGAQYDDWTKTHISSLKSWDII